MKKEEREQRLQNIAEYAAGDSAVANQVRLLTQLTVKFLYLPPLLEKMDAPIPCP